MSQITEYLELAKKHQHEYGVKTMVLMQVGVFFEVYGLHNNNDNIQTFSSVCDLNIAEKKYLNGTALMAGFKDYLLEKYLKKLQDAHFTVAVYTQDEDADESNQSQSSSKKTRSLQGIYSPGTYFQPETTVLTNCISCIWVYYSYNRIRNKASLIIGVSNIDILNGTSSIYEYKEDYIKNSPTVFDELERFLSINVPSECIIISDFVSIDDIIQYAKITCPLVHRHQLSDNDNISALTENTEPTVVFARCEKQPYQLEIFKRYYKTDILPDCPVACQSLCFLLDFVHQHNPHLTCKLKEPAFENCSKHLLLANHSLKQLNIINDGNAEGQYSSVLNFLNDCATPMGKREFAHRLLNPIIDCELLTKEYDRIDEILLFFDSFESNGATPLVSCGNTVVQRSYKPLKKNTVADLPKLLRLFVMQKITLNHIQTIWKTLTYISSINIIEEGLIDIISYIESWINVETLEFKPGINSHLDNQMRLLSIAEKEHEAMCNYLNGLLGNSSGINVNETTMAVSCTKRRAQTVMKECSKTKHITLNYRVGQGIFESIKSFVFVPSFTVEPLNKTNDILKNDQLDDCAKTIVAIRAAVQDTLKSMVKEFVGDFYEKYCDELEQISNAIMEYDVITCKARVAKKYGYSRPIIRNTDQLTTDSSHTQCSYVKVKDLRHCLVEQINQKEIYVANDISDRQILLYGTNAVGKTTLVRALGIAVIMAQAGMFVPATKFEYYPFKQLFTRIIGNDNMFKGLSTFVMEIMELRTILKMADENSLVLGDELCSGTEMTSATSVFTAGVSWLKQRNTSFIFATHMHEIVDYDEIQGITLKHMSVRYDKQTNELVYCRKIEDGPGSNVYGLEVCKSLNLPTEFLRLAQDICNKYYFQNSSILAYKTSRYNSLKLVGMCEKCGKNMGTEVHHIQQQSLANDAGIITLTQSDIESLDNDSTVSFHKHHLQNLMTVCEKCHREFHSS